MGYFTGFPVSPPSPRSHRTALTIGAAASGCPHFQPSTTPGSTTFRWIQFNNQELVYFLSKTVPACSKAAKSKAQTCGASTATTLCKPTSDCASAPATKKPNCWATVEEAEEEDALLLG
ncbi:hypothetical protein K438DRAFT_827840 [Mycena galopus ATCC 62051]|nr:hypothetical protein K438DRAFT_827840 [Mycena galopus ATCC 62051]